MCPKGGAPKWQFFKHDDEPSTLGEPNSQTSALVGMARECQCTFFNILLFRAQAMLERFLFRGRYTNMRMIGAGQFGTARLPSFHEWRLWPTPVVSGDAEQCDRWVGPVAGALGAR